MKDECWKNKLAVAHEMNLNIIVERSYYFFRALILMVTNELTRTICQNSLMFCTKSKDRTVRSQHESVLTISGSFTKPTRQLREREKQPSQSSWRLQSLGNKWCY